MEPSNKNAPAKEPVPQAYALDHVIAVWNQEYIPKAHNLEEKLRIFKSHVLILFTLSGNEHALMGLMLEPKEELYKCKELFPSYHSTKHVISIKKQLDLEYQTNDLRVFRSAPLPRTTVMTISLGWTR